jgi:hypothetical protein
VQAVHETLLAHYHDIAQFSYDFIASKDTSGVGSSNRKEVISGKTGYE